MKSATDNSLCTDTEVFVDNDDTVTMDQATQHTLRHFRDEEPYQSLDWCKLNLRETKLRQKTTAKTLAKLLT